MKVYKEMLDERKGRAIVIEMKRAAVFGELDAGCLEALKQIEDGGTQKVWEPSMERFCAMACAFIKRDAW